MNYMLRLDTDELLTVCNKIDKTTAEIDKVLNNIQSINNNVFSGWNDDSAKDFNENFGRYINEVKAIVPFYTELTKDIKKYAKTYETTDLDLSTKVGLQSSQKVIFDMEGSK